MYSAPGIAGANICVCVCLSLCSFTDFQGSGLLQRELIRAFFLAFSVATLTGLQRGNLSVSTTVLRNKRVRPGVFCKVQRIPFFIKWKQKKRKKKNAQFQELASARYLQVETTASKQGKNQQYQKEEKKKIYVLSPLALSFLLFYFNQFCFQENILINAKYNHITIQELSSTNTALMCLRQIFCYQYFCALCT